jgi:shikimate dehydrogenase
MNLSMRGNNLIPAIVIPSVDDFKQLIESKDKNLMNRDDLSFEFRVDLDPRLLDYIDDLNKEFKQKIILTLRSVDEGGKFDGDSNYRKSFLKKMMAKPVKCIDLEFYRDRDNLSYYLSQSNSNNLILSYHNFKANMLQSGETFLQDIESFFSMLNAEKYLTTRENIIIKFVGRPLDAYQSLATLKLFQNKSKFKFICLGIGSKGELTRTLGQNFNNYLAFGSLTPNDIFPIEHILNTQTPDSHISGLIGKSLGHTLSPQIHEILRNHSGLKGYYHKFEINEDNVIKFIKEVSETNIIGLNVTFPYKDLAVSATDSQTDEVLLLGATNTISFTKEGIISYNTDVTGFQKVLQFYNIKDKKVLIFGAGSSSRSVSYTNLLEKNQVSVIYRSEKRVAEFKELSDQITFLKQEEISTTKGYDVFINTTPLGLDINENPLDYVSIDSDTNYVIDIAYGHRGTSLTNEKSLIKSNKVLLDGKFMLFHQAVDAFEIWTSKKIDRENTYNKFLKKLNF